MVVERSTKSKATLYGLLDRIRRNPHDFLRRRTFTSLGDFLQGFSIAQHGVVYGHYGTENEPLFDDFGLWFHLHHGCPTAGWFPEIMTQSRNTRDAFDRFFEYLTAYRDRSLGFRHSFALSAAQRKHYSALWRARAPKKLRISRYRGERCVFLHGCWDIHHGWQNHAGFKSMDQCRRWLAKVYGITPSLWKRIARGD